MELSILLMFSSFALGQSPPIVNGEETDEWPAVGMLAACQGQNCEVFCSATVIHEEWVLTAAQCVEVALQDMGGMEHFFITGSAFHDYSEYVTITDWYIHPDYTYNQQGVFNDIALAKFSGTLTMADPMPVNRDGVSNSWQEITYVGFGVTYDGGNDSGIKRTAVIPFYGRDNYMIYTYDESQQNQQNLCSGDSGGAAFWWDGEQYVLAGVNSFVFAMQSNQTSCVGGGAAAARVDKAINFIEDYLTLPGTESESEPSQEPAEEPAEEPSVESEMEPSADTETDTIDSNTDTNLQQENEQPSQDNAEMSGNNEQAPAFKWLVGCSTGSLRYEGMLWIVALLFLPRRRRELTD